MISASPAPVLCPSLIKVASARTIVQCSIASQARDRQTDRRLERRDARSKRASERVSQMIFVQKQNRSFFKSEKGNIETAETSCYKKKYLAATSSPSLLLWFLLQEKKEKIKWNERLNVDSIKDGCYTAWTEQTHTHTHTHTGIVLNVVSSNRNTTP